MKKYIILFMAVAGIIACKKDGLFNPAIIITSPTSGQMLNSGDSALVDISISDADLHEMTLSVVNTADNSIVYFEDGAHSHDADLHYAEKFKVPVVGVHTNVTMIVHAEDHNGNASEESVDFAFMP